MIAEVQTKTVKNPNSEKEPQYQDNEEPRIGAHFEREESFIRLVMPLVKKASILKLFMALNYHADNKTGVCWPSVKLLQEETGLSRNTVFASLRELEALGVLETVKEQRGHRTPRRRMLVAAGYDTWKAYKEEMDFDRKQRKINFNDDIKTRKEEKETVRGTTGDTPKGARGTTGDTPKALGVLQSGTPILTIQEDITIHTDLNHSGESGNGSMEILENSRGKETSSYQPKKRRVKTRRSLKEKDQLARAALSTPAPRYDKFPDWLIQHGEALRELFPVEEVSEAGLRKLLFYVHEGSLLPEDPNFTHKFALERLVKCCRYKLRMDAEGHKSRTPAIVLLKNCIRDPEDLFALQFSEEWDKGYKRDKKQKEKADSSRHERRSGGTAHIREVLPLVKRERFICVNEKTGEEWSSEGSPDPMNRFIEDHRERWKRIEEEQRRETEELLAAAG